MGELIEQSVRISTPGPDLIKIFKREFIPQFLNTMIGRNFFTSNQKALKTNIAKINANIFGDRIGWWVLLIKIIVSKKHFFVSPESNLHRKLHKIIEQINYILD